MDMSEIRIIPVPRALVVMWESLESKQKDYVEKRIGYLPTLLYIEPRIAMIKALSHFWNSKTSTFVFGRNELTPTIEEYDIAIGRVGSFGLVSPPIDIDPITLLS